MEVSALRYSGGIGLHARSPLLRLQSDERLIALVRRGNASAFEMLVSRYQSRLLAFCRHLLASREDAEDVLQEVFTAAYNAMVADDRPINVRPWLYRIARNRCLNHLRRIQPVGVDSMDVHFSDHGASTADKVHMAEEFRLLVGDIHSLPETQRTALVLREMDALSYDQIAEAMETTVPSVKSLLVRARLGLAEAAEARMLTCDAVRMELAEVAEGLLPKASAPVRRHLRSCQRCAGFHNELKRTSKVLAALLPLGPVALLKSLAIAHLGHSAGAAGGASAGSGAATGASAAAGGAAAGGAGVAAGGAIIGAGAGNIIPLGLGAIATKTAAGLAAAALVTAGAVDISHQTAPRRSGTPHLQGVLTPSAASAADAAVAEVAQAPALVMRAADPYSTAAPFVHHVVHASVPVHRHVKKTAAAKKATDMAAHTDAKGAKATDVKTAATSTEVKTTTTNTKGKRAAAAGAHKVKASTSKTPPTTDGTHPQLTTSSDTVAQPNNQLTSPTPAPTPSNSSPNTGASSSTAPSSPPSAGSSTAAGGGASSGGSSTTAGGASSGGSSSGGSSSGGASVSTGGGASTPQSAPPTAAPASAPPSTVTAGSAVDTTGTVPAPAPSTGS